MYKRQEYSGLALGAIVDVEKDRKALSEGLDTRRACWNRRALIQTWALDVLRYVFSPARLCIASAFAGELPGGVSNSRLVILAIFGAHGALRTHTTIMDHPKREITGVVKGLVSAKDANEQCDTLQRYFLPDASFDHPLCAVSSYSNVSPC